MFSKTVDSFLVELVLGFEQIACKRALQVSFHEV